MKHTAVIGKLAHYQNCTYMQAPMLHSTLHIHKSRIHIVDHIYIYINNAYALTHDAFAPSVHGPAMGMISDSDVYAWPT